MKEENMRGLNGQTPKVDLKEKDENREGGLEARTLCVLAYMATHTHNLNQN
jgi:hypothetical protein